MMTGQQREHRVSASVQNSGKRCVLCDRVHHHAGDAGCDEFNPSTSDPVLQSKSGRLRQEHGRQNSWSHFK